MSSHGGSCHCAFVQGGHVLTRPSVQSRLVRIVSLNAWGGAMYEDEGGHEYRQDFGIAAFIAESLPIIGLRSAFVHGAFVDHDQWPSGGRPRVAQALRVLDRASQRLVTVVHLHGLRDAPG